MDSKVILNKNFYKTIFFFTLVFSFVIAKKIYASENLHYLSSYYGSLLAGQIAKYNNENKIASKYYRFANQKNPKNSDILELSLMSSLLSGDIKLALEDLEKYDNNLSTENSKISQLLKFIKYIKNENYKKALKLLNQNEEIIITTKVQPIIKAWLADSFSKAKSEIDQFEYKSDGLVMSDIYFIHLALINNFYKDKANAINIFEKTLNSGVDNRLRHMFFYKNLIDDKVEENKIIKSFVNKNPSHSFNIYVNKKNLNDFKVSTRKDGISESLFNIAEALYSQRMYDLSIAYCYLSLYLNKNNFINYYLLSQNFIMLQKAEKAISVLQNIPLNSYLGWNSFLKIADIKFKFK